MVTTIPGFNAERSLGRESGRYRSAAANQMQAQAAQVIPSVRGTFGYERRCCEWNQRLHRFVCMNHFVAPWDNCQCIGSAIQCQPPVLTQF